MKKKIGVIGSAGGSAIFEILPFLDEMNFDLIVATDRSSGIEKRCKDNDVVFKRFKYVNKNQFSNAVSIFFDNEGVIETVLVYYTKLLGEQIYKKFKTINFHPSLLPNFKGLNALHKQIKLKVPFIGVTAHYIDESLDGGPIIGKIKNKYSLKNYKRVSFLQKVFLTLSVIDSSVKQKKKFTNSDLHLSEHALEFFRSIEKTYKLKIIQES